MTTSELLLADELLRAAMLASTPIAFRSVLERNKIVLDVKSRCARPEVVDELCNEVQKWAMESEGKPHRNPKDAAICAALVAMHGYPSSTVLELMQWLKCKKDPSLWWVRLFVMTYEPKIPAHKIEGKSAFSLLTRLGESVLSKPDALKDLLVE